MKKLALIFCIFLFSGGSIAFAQSYEIIRGDDEIKVYRDNRIVNRDIRKIKNRHHVRRIARKVRHAKRKVRLATRINRHKFHKKNRVYVRRYVDRGNVE